MRQLEPRSRRRERLAILSVVASLVLYGASVLAQEAGVSQPRPFDVWLADLTAEARDRGYSEALIAEALVGLTPLERVIASDRSQPELTLDFSRYLSRVMSAETVRRGREMSVAHEGVLGRIEQAYGVQRRFVLAIWGLETRYGRVTGDTPVFQALATLAWEPRRAGFFRGQLFDALTMVQRGHIDAASMKGSWAGAMGQTQFIPSSYLAYAADFDEDGRRDIWNSTADALASIANYLKGSGWNGDQTWGREVRVPSEARAAIERSIPNRSGGCAARRATTERRPLTEWDAFGVRLADGGTLPTADVEAGLVDVEGRSFLVYRNYDAILAYNCAHYYALTVSLLAEQLR